MYIDGLGSYPMTDREFLTKMREQLADQRVEQPVLDRLQLVIDRLEPARLIAAVRAYEDHMLRGLEDE